MSEMQRDGSEMRCKRCGALEGAITKEKRTVDADFRIGRGDGLWENYRVERTLKITLPFGQKELSPVELKEIENYGILLANREQAIIRVEIVDTPYIIFSPTKWKKRK